jgi:prevent-host-death family protein
MWQLQTAKQKLSELVERALTEGPQVITRRGREVVVVVSIDEYRRLRGTEPDFKRFLREGPDFEALDLERSTEPARTVEL